MTDQFFTKPETVQICLDFFKQHYNLNDFDIIIEPSAGQGNFYDNLPFNTQAVELDPNLCQPNWLNEDYLTFTPDPKYKKILVIGNPPYGYLNKISLQFINHSASFAEVIAFVLPRSYKKSGLINRLHPNLHIVSVLDLPKKSCVGTSCKTCFVILEKRKEVRTKIIEPTTHPDFEFLQPEIVMVKPITGAYSTIKEKKQCAKLGVNECYMIPPQNNTETYSSGGSKYQEISGTGGSKYQETSKVGGSTSVVGKIQEPGSHTPKTTIYIRAIKITDAELIMRLNTLDLSCATDSAHQCNFGRKDIVREYTKLYGSGK